MKILAILFFITSCYTLRDIADQYRKGVLIVKKDSYEKICDFFGLQTGPVPDKNNLISALKQSISESAAEIYLLTPMFGEISMEKLIQKAERSGFSVDEIEIHIKSLINEAFLEKHYHEEEIRLARVLSAFVAENQVRKKKGSALGKRWSKYWLDLSQVSARNLPSKTPYARVLPAEESLAGESNTEKIPINRSVALENEAVPYDFVTKLMQDASLIAVAECYCRLAMEMDGKPCEHEKETCFILNQAARSVIDIGVAREVSVQEALKIIQRAEDAGLVHHINNCQEEISFLCNCCPCCCPIMASLRMKVPNVAAVSRYVVHREPQACVDCGECVSVCYFEALTFDGSLSINSDQCVGCGLCVSRCPEHALEMRLREKGPSTQYENPGDLNSKIQREAIFGKIKSLIFGG